MTLELVYVTTSFVLCAIPHQYHNFKGGLFVPKWYLFTKIIKCFVPMRVASWVLFNFDTLSQGNDFESQKRRVTGRSLI